MAGELVANPAANGQICGIHPRFVDFLAIYHVTRHVSIFPKTKLNVLSNGASFVSIRWVCKKFSGAQGRHGKVAFLENRDFAEILLKIDLLQFWGAFSKPGAFPKPAQLAK